MCITDVLNKVGNGAEYLTFNGNWPLGTAFTNLTADDLVEQWGEGTTSGVTSVYSGLPG